jgi:hypothetical protein
MDDAKQQEVREALDKVLTLLREQKTTQSLSQEKGRAVSIAITEVEKASMCVIRSFFADEEYSPLKKLAPAEVK